MESPERQLSHMHGSIVKAAAILGASIVLSVALLGVGAWILVERAVDRVTTASERLAQAVERAPGQIAIKQPVSLDLPNAMKVGFEPKLPLRVQAENSINEHTGGRAQFELQLFKGPDKEK